MEELLRGLREDAVGELPAAEVAEELNSALSGSPTVVLTAPPGAGKSTLLPLTMLRGAWNSGRILMLEPRRLAARQIAERMAWLLGEPVGKTVGYRVRFESRVSAQTRIEVLTEGILTRRLISDPTLEGVSAVIFDEFHERSLNSDVALALTRECQGLVRPDLRLVIMSATIDTDAIRQALAGGGQAVPLVCSQGRMFPVELLHAASDATELNAAETVAHAVREALHKHEGDILAFLPGEADIRRCAELLANLTDGGDCAGVDAGGAFPRAASFPGVNPSNAFPRAASFPGVNPCNSFPGGSPGCGVGECQRLRVLPLYGMLPPAAQKEAIAPSRAGERKVVLSTPIAETSLTIQGVRVVIDSGLCRKMVFDPQSGLSHLETVRISMDMADQRSGRAGRVAPGVCYRLWTMATESRMAATRVPEILEADLAPMLLDVAAWGEPDASRLPWLTPPPSSHLSQAAALLESLGATDTSGTLTKHGRELAALPCHPRIAQMLSIAQSSEDKELAADIAALLEEADPMPDEPSADIDIRLCELARLRRSGSSGGRRWGNILRSADQYLSIADRRRTDPQPGPIKSATAHSDAAKPATSQPGAAKPATAHQGADMPASQPSGAVHRAALSAGALIAAAYPERIAKARSEGHFALSCGDAAFTPASDSLSAHAWLAVARFGRRSAAEGRIFLAAALEPQELRWMMTERDNICWDARREAVTAQREWRLGGLVVESKPLHDRESERIVDAICQAAVKQGTSMLDFNADVENLQRRVAALASWHPELGLPDLSTDAVLASAPEWLPLYLGKATTLAELKKIDLCQALWGLLSYEQQQAVERLAPSHVTVPTGSRIRLEYRQGADYPVLRVRLQECFGLTDTPCVDGGRVKVLMELLSPGFKPVQLTQDLRSFWQGTYFEVRAELRRRYPKHSWPDNPLEAEAVRGTGKRRQ